MSASGSDNKILMSYNPEICWIQDLEGKKGIQFIFSNYKDNPFLEESYIEMLLSLKDEDVTYYKIYTLGKRARAGNIIYAEYIMEKEWLSSEDSRVRTRLLPNRLYDHKEMDGVKVQLAERFNVNGDALRFPADYEGQAGNIINCRCAVAVLPKRDENGNLIRKN